MTMAWPTVLVSGGQRWSPACCRKAPDGVPGAFRVNPDGAGTAVVERPDTGKGSLAGFVADAVGLDGGSVLGDGGGDPVGRRP